jgi:hypothetical protein
MSHVVDVAAATAADPARWTVRTRKRRNRAVFTEWR